MHTLSTPKPLLIAAWACAAAVLLLNVSMLITGAVDWVDEGGGVAAYTAIGIVTPVGACLLVLLVYIALCKISPGSGFRQLLPQDDIELSMGADPTALNNNNSSSNDSGARNSVGAVS
eukprot:EC715042.1.p1 GENE.EC715042.1~~EC715042.1.p1  ORF type:complete len:118 (+),score=22.08 EC715042.1:100-453(+)